MLFANNKESLAQRQLLSPLFDRAFRNVPRQPGDFLGRVLKPRARVSHTEIYLDESLLSEILSMDLKLNRQGDQAKL